MRPSLARAFATPSLPTVSVTRVAAVILGVAKSIGGTGVSNVVENRPHRVPLAVLGEANLAVSHLKPRYGKSNHPREAIDHDPRCRRRQHDLVHASARNQAQGLAHVRRRRLVRTRRAPTHVNRATGRLEKSARAGLRENRVHAGKHLGRQRDVTKDYVPHLDVRTGKACHSRERERRHLGVDVERRAARADERAVAGCHETSYGIRHGRAGNRRELALFVTQLLADNRVCPAQGPVYVEERCNALAHCQSDLSFSGLVEGSCSHRHHSSEYMSARYSITCSNL